MVLRMLGSAAALLGQGSSSRALAASTRTGAPAAAHNALFGASRRSRPAAGAAFMRTPLVRHRRHRHMGGTGHVSCSTDTARGGRCEPRQGPRKDASWVENLRHRHRATATPLRASSLGPRDEDSRQVGEDDFWRGADSIDDDDFREPPTGSRKEALGLLEDDDKAEWMDGVDIDPDAEAIFYGDKIPFSDLGLSEVLCGHLKALDLPHSTAVQASAIPGILRGEDVIIGAETGSGKTLAYLLPIVERLLRGQAKSPDLPDELLGNARGWPMFPDVIVLVPNKELCEQVLSVLKGILKALAADGNSEVTAAAMYGSSYEYPYSPSQSAPSLLVCTPSFLHKYANMRAIPLFCKATTLVMDEADMLMEGSYKKQLDDILVSFRRADKVRVDGYVGQDGSGRIAKTQYVLAAATLPTYGLKSVDQYVKRAFPQARKIQQVHMHKHHPAIQQEFVKAGEDVFDKIHAVIELLRGSSTDSTRTMVFANTAASCKLACEALSNEGFSVVPYHKDIVPLERLENLRALRSGRATVLVCTDLAARGIDIPSVAHIVQLEMATNVVQHLHRLGRAARAGRAGRATNFFDETTKDLVNSIRDAEGSRLDGSFSRQRGFRNKFKKYGPSRTFQGETREQTRQRR